MPRMLAPSILVGCNITECTVQILAKEPLQTLNREDNINKNYFHLRNHNPNRFYLIISTESLTPIQTILFSILTLNKILSRNVQESFSVLCGV